MVRVRELFILVEQLLPSVDARMTQSTIHPDHFSIESHSHPRHMSSKIVSALSIQSQVNQPKFTRGFMILSSCIETNLHSTPMSSGTEQGTHSRGWISFPPYIYARLNSVLCWYDVVNQASLFSMHTSPLLQNPILVRSYSQ